MMALQKCFFPINSRPHKEVDLFFTQKWDFIDLSIHDLTRRSTNVAVMPSQVFVSFNSRPHKEVDSKYPQISRIFV